MKVVIVSVCEPLDVEVPVVQFTDHTDLLTFVQDQYDLDQRYWLKIEKEVVHGVEMVQVWPKNEDEEFWLTTYIKQS